MNNKNVNKKNIEENRSGLPALIIAGVLLTAIIGGWWLYSSSKANPGDVNKPSNVNTPPKSPTPQSTPMISNQRGAEPAHFKGGQNASVVIEEFYDFQCPSCASVHPTLNEMSSTYGTRIKVISRNFPIAQIHPNAYDAAIASEAAGLQGKFYEIQNLIFQNQQRWSTAPNLRLLLESYAENVGIDVEKYKADIAGMEARQRVEADMQRGRSLGVNSTPTILINGKLVPPDQMNASGLRVIIDAELKATGGGQTQTAPAKPAQNTAANSANSNAGNK